ncbi:putative Calpain family cysteine protease [Trypanosoma vivax]|uniref:Putative calpain-like cysteine peptidase n=1 Tax=Trypanosoma vivax (strain Y486) TaxID=1055687 RepID=G0U463_TRYVY|nr:putative Calpain family cysteine protease [Trypanosoma vivax]CCC52225.1 putative calpain-like cysteine peptidase [Trypanosoma vivax Y486]
MEVVTVAEEYTRISKQLGIKIYSGLVDALKKCPKEFDLSMYMYSHSFFECIIRLTERRCELEKLDLSGMQIPTDKLLVLFALLKDTSVKYLILRNVPLNATAGKALKALVIEHEGLHYVDTTKTNLPEELDYAVQLQVEINRMKFAELGAKSQKAVEPEAPKLCRWRLESWIDDVSTSGVPVIADNSDYCDRIMQRAIENRVIFTDDDFPPEKALKGSRIQWARVGSLVHSKKERELCCTGGRTLIPSAINDSINLCAALNIVQQVHYLRKSLCFWRLPEIGAFAFRFFVGKCAVEVVVDDRIPVIGKIPVGIHHPVDCGDYWGCLVEKAFAKLHGGYDNISGISFSYALSCLTGGVCFAIEASKLKERQGDTDMFKFIRNSMNAKRIIAFIAKPRKKEAALALKEMNIIPNMTYLLSNLNVYKGNNSYHSYVVKFSQPDDMTSKSTFCIPSLLVRDAPDLSGEWMSLEHVLTYFDKPCILLWPHGDPLAIRKYVVERPSPCFGGPDYVSTFANNSSFFLSNPDKFEKEIMLVLRSDKGDQSVANSQLQMHIFKGYRDSSGPVLRCDICSRNELLSTKKTKGGEVGLVISLRGNEDLQITTSASFNCFCILSATCCDSFELVPLPLPKCHTFASKWDIDSALRPSLTLVNNTEQICNSVTVAISQGISSDHLIGIGLQVKCVESVVLGDVQPIHTTEFRADPLVVFRLSISVHPGQIYNFVPLFRKLWGPVEFSMSVYSDVTLEVVSDDSIFGDKCSTDVL